MNNLDKQYTNLLQDILDNGIQKGDRTGTGTLSLFGRQIRHKMSDGFPLLTCKKMFFKGIVTELLWFLRGDTNIKFLVDNGCHIWDGDAYKRFHQSFPETEMLSKEDFINCIKTDDVFAKKWGELGPIYGRMWRMFDEDTYEGIDQIANLINDLKTNPDSRRLLVTAWHPGYNQHSVLPPCHYGFQVYTRELTFGEKFDLAVGKKGEWEQNMKNMEEGREFYLSPAGIESRFGEPNFPKRAISLMWNQRSVDTFLGLPFNIASYGLLLEIIAKAVNMVPDELIGNLGDVHLYSNHVEQAKEQISREPYPLPTLNINTEWWPTEGGECGEGPLDAVAIFNGFSNDNFCKCLLEEDIQLGNYQSHPSIKAPLSN